MVSHPITKVLIPVNLHCLRFSVQLNMKKGNPDFRNTSMALGAKNTPTPQIGFSIGVGYCLGVLGGGNMSPC